MDKNKLIILNILPGHYRKIQLVPSMKKVHAFNYFHIL